MSSTDIDRVNHLIIELIVEFEKEAGKLRADYDNSNMRIQEIDENIFNYKENEDVDIQVFSPRKVDNKQEVRLDSLNKEKDEMQSSVRDISRQLKYYTDKIDKLKEIKSILNNEPGDDNDVSRGIESIFNIDEKIKAESENTNRNSGDNNSLSMTNDKRSDTSNDFKDNTTISSNDLDSLHNMLSSDKDNRVDNSALINSLSRISHKADVGYKIVDNDSFRAKMEFKSIKSNLEDIIYSLK